MGSIGGGGNNPGTAPAAATTSPDDPDAAKAVPTSGGHWFPVLGGDGFSVDVDGSINFPGARDAGDTFDVQFVYGSGTSSRVPLCTAVHIVPRPFRATFAIPTDHRLTYAVKLATVDDGVKIPVYNDSESDVDDIAPPFRRMYLADTGQLYSNEIRAPGAFPVPESCITSNKYNTGFIRNDWDYIQAHSQRKLREVGRLDKGGGNPLYSPHILPGVHPGEMIKALGNSGGGGYPMRCCVVEVVLNYERQSTERVIQ